MTAKTSKGNRQAVIEEVPWEELEKIKRREREDEIQKLTLKKLRNETPAARKPSYDSKAGVLSFAGKKIEISPNTNQGSLCNVLFGDEKSIAKEWSWYEVIEGWGDRHPNKSMCMKVYYAGREVNKKVAIKTTISDLLIVKKRSISVNPKYLRK